MYKQLLLLSTCHCVGKQLASVGVRRRSTYAVWKTGWQCWRVRTRPSSES